MLLPRVLAARPSALIDGTISTVIRLSRSTIAGSVLNDELAGLREARLAAGGLVAVHVAVDHERGELEIASAVSGGFG